MFTALVLAATLAAVPPPAPVSGLDGIALTQVQVPVFTEPSVKNPSAVTFEPSVDHATIDGYELDIMRPDGTVLQTINLGKPAVVTNLCTAAVNVQPIAFGKDYWMRARAVAGTSTSPYANSLNPFERAPGGPTKVIAK